MKCHIKKGFRCDGQRCASCPEHGTTMEVGEYTADRERAIAARTHRCPGGECDEGCPTGRPPETGTDRRRAILEEVEACVCRDRQNSYGDAEDNFVDIATVASVVLGDLFKRAMRSDEVATFMACVKLVRMKTSPNHLDNWVDLAGYGVCGAGIVKSRTA